MKLEFSAGGVVYKRDGEKLYILLGQHSAHHGWVFPKGLIGDNIKGESKENTALREVAEETGAEGKIIASLKPVQFWYQFDGQKIKKTVYYFVMEYIGGDITRHDHEMEQVEWLPTEDVTNRLTYKSDKVVWQEAQKLIK